MPTQATVFAADRKVGMDMCRDAAMLSRKIGQALERLWLDCVEGRVANDYAALSAMAEVYRH